MKTPAPRLGRPVALHLTLESTFWPLNSCSLSSDLKLPPGGKGGRNAPPMVQTCAPPNGDVPWLRPPQMALVRTDQCHGLGWTCIWVWMVIRPVLGAGSDLFWAPPGAILKIGVLQGFTQCESFRDESQFRGHIFQVSHPFCWLSPPQTAQTGARTPVWAISCSFRPTMACSGCLRLQNENGRVARSGAQIKALRSAMQLSKTVGTCAIGDPSLPHVGPVGHAQSHRWAVPQHSLPRAPFPGRCSRGPRGAVVSCNR